MNPTLQSFLALNEKLTRNGFHACSKWWLGELTRFLESGARRWVVRAGRRAGKSTTCARLAVAKALAGDFTIPRGDTGVIAFVSVDRKEARARLKTVREILQTIGVPFEERGEEIELTDRNVVFRVITGSVSGVVGFTSIAIFADEMARWESNDTYANPAREIIGSLSPTMATMPSAIEACISSPWSNDDYHCELFDRGNTEHQCVSFAPTWIANPSISEEKTRADEPDARTWSREYAAVPGAVLSGALDPDHLLDAFARPPQGGFQPPAVIGVDPSSLKNDSFAWVVAQVDATGCLCITRVGCVLASEHLTTDEAIKRVRTDAWLYSARTAYGDSYLSLTNDFFKVGIQYNEQKWTLQSKKRAFDVLRRLLRDGKLSLPEHPGLRSELFSLQARLVSAGEVFETNGRDFASALVAIAMAIADGQFSVEAAGGNGGLPPAATMMAMTPLLLQLAGGPRDTTPTGQHEYGRALEEYEAQDAAHSHAREIEAEKARLRKVQNADCFRDGCGRPRSEHHHEPPHVISKIWGREPCAGYLAPPRSPGV